MQITKKLKPSAAKYLRKKRKLKFTPIAIGLTAPVIENTPRSDNGLPRR